MTTTNWMDLLDKVSDLARVSNDERTFMSMTFLDVKNMKISLDYLGIHGVAISDLFTREIINEMQLNTSFNLILFLWIRLAFLGKKWAEEDCRVIRLIAEAYIKERTKEVARWRK